MDHALPSILPLFAQTPEVSCTLCYLDPRDLPCPTDIEDVKQEGCRRCRLHGRLCIGPLCNQHSKIAKDIGALRGCSQEQLVAVKQTLMGAVLQCRDCYPKGPSEFSLHGLDFPNTFRPTLDVSTYDLLPEIADMHCTQCLLNYTKPLPCRHRCYRLCHDGEPVAGEVRYDGGRLGHDSEQWVPICISCRKVPNVCLQPHCTTHKAAFKNIVRLIEVWTEGDNTIAQLPGVAGALHRDMLRCSVCATQSGVDMIKFWLFGQNRSLAYNAFAEWPLTTDNDLLEFMTSLGSADLMATELTEYLQRTTS